MGHLVGIRDFYEKSWDEIFIQKHYNNLAEALYIFKDDPLVNEPGTTFLFSSYGYILLVAAIGKVSQQNYLEYMKQHIWDPLEMNSTYGDIADSIMSNKSRFYFTNGEEATAYDLSYSYPAGGLISTTDDLVKFGNAITKDDFLSAKTKKEIFETQQTRNGTQTGYGLGWYVGTDIQNKTIWYHFGELPSSGSALLIYTEEKLVLALLTNSPIVTDSDDELLKILFQLAEMIRSK